MFYVSCSKTEKKIKYDSSTYDEFTNFNVDLKPLDIASTKTIISFKNFKFELVKIKDRVYLKYYAKINGIPNWEQVFFNANYLNYSTDILNDVHFLFNEKLQAGFVLFPSYSEELMTYYVYKFDNYKTAFIGDFSIPNGNSSKILNDENELMNFNSCKFQIKEFVNKLSLICKATNDKTYFYYPVEKTEKHTDVYFMQDIEKIKSFIDELNLEKITASVLKTQYLQLDTIASLDLNMDKIEDKILVFDNKHETDNLEEDQRNIPVYVCFGVGNENYRVLKNDKFKHLGFYELIDKVVTKDNYFTIQFIEEKPDVIFLETFVTFKYDKNLQACVLHKLSKIYEYGGKTYHLTSKDFGIIRFEDFKSDLIYKLQEKFNLNKIE